MAIASVFFSKLPIQVAAPTNLGGPSREFEGYNAYAPGRSKRHAHSATGAADACCVDAKKKYCGVQAVVIISVIEQQQCM